MQVPPGFRAIRSEQEAKALAHPLREAILSALRQEASVSEVAVRLGEPVARVHHHLQPLLRAGFVAYVRTVPEGRTRRKLYRTVAPDLWFEHDRFPAGGYGPAWQRLDRGVQAFLEDVARTYEAARRDGPDPADTLLQTEVRLDSRLAACLPAILAGLMRSVEATAASTSEPDAGVYRVTFVSRRARS